MLGQQMKGMQDYVQSERGATAIAAGLITTAAGVAVGYVGGKGAVMTACMVGGGLFALATTFAVAELGVRSAVRGYGWLARKAEKKPEMQRVDEHRVVQAS